MMRSVFTALAITALSAIPSQAASITFNLNCELGNTTVNCPVASYGTVTLDELPGDGDLLLTVDLTGTGEKFKDLLFNYNGSAAAITAGSGTTNLLDPNGETLPPYSGRF